jgi:hypothetical protein
MLGFSMPPSNAYCWAVIAVLAFGCAYSDFNVAHGTASGAAGTGGSSGGKGSTAGSSNTGGRTGTASSTTGGSFATGGTHSSAGSVSTGGSSSAAGGSSSKGGGSALGGTSTTGGHTSLATGGRSATSGGTSGGVSASGGATSLPTGGRSSPGGNAGTGGSVSPSNCVVYVTKSGNDILNSGTSWAQALANVQPALIAARSRMLVGSSCSTVEVWVAKGIYMPTQLTDASDSRTATFQLMNNVALYGGFSGSESSRAERSLGNVTTLSGDVGVPNEPKDNSYHVVTGTSGAVMDGFTITGGNASGGDTSAWGGGMFNNDSPWLTVTNCTFQANKGTYGGGMFNNNCPSLTVTNCTFEANKATLGAGMFNSSSSPTLTFSTFSNNSADSNGGGMFNSSSSPTLTNCTFSSNSAVYGGGGLYNESSAPNATNCTFSGNSAVYGGGVYNESSSPDVTNCTFSSNSATAGGAMDNSDFSSPTVLNSIFWNDQAMLSGDEIYNSTSTSSPLVSYCIVEGGYGGTGNLSSDPLLNSDLTLKKGSPAVDAGGCGTYVLSTDSQGRSRWDMSSVPNGTATGNSVDIGANEYQGSSARGDTNLTDTGVSFACR